MTTLLRLVFFVLTVYVYNTLLAQCHSSDPALNRVPTRVLRSRIALLPDGHIHEEVTTSSPVAQKYYDQGLLLLYAYDWINAARSFSEALRRDPHLALAHLGLSFAYTGLGDVGAAHSE